MAVYGHAREIEEIPEIPEIRATTAALAVVGTGDLCFAECVPRPGTALDASAH